jgi:hypothetical protein
MPSRFLVESLLETWRHFLGFGDCTGFLARLTPEQRVQTTTWLQEQQADGLLVASIYYSAYLTRVEELDDLRVSLRDLWRSILAAQQFPLDEHVAAKALDALSTLVSNRTAADRAQVQRELVNLADFETADTFTGSIAEAESAWFDQVVVMRPALKRQESVTCLFLRPDPARFRTSAMPDLLSRWMRFETRDFYRIQIEGSRALCFFDVPAHQGVYWAGEGSDPRDFTSAPEAPQPWDASLTHLFGSIAGLRDREAPWESHA